MQLCFLKGNSPLHQPYHHPSYSILVSGDPRGSYPRLKVRLISGPCNRGTKQLGGRPRERTEVPALLVQGLPVEALIQLHLTLVISRLLASHMLHIRVHLKLYPPQVSRDGIHGWWLL